MKHSHYFRDVSTLTEVDVYRVCDLFQVNDPSGATQHAVKKLLLPGQRGGGKDLRKDLQEAADTIARRIEMLDEDERPKVAKPTVFELYSAAEEARMDRSGPHYVVPHG